MAQLETELGYGKRAIIETDTFTRLLKGEVYDDEELRKDVSGAYEYVALAKDGSASSAAVWYCVRVTWQDGHKTRMQYRADIRWDQKDQGWNP